MLPLTSIYVNVSNSTIFSHLYNHRNSFDTDLMLIQMNIQTRVGVHSLAHGRQGYSAGYVFRTFVLSKKPKHNIYTRARR